jgi:hypothetical protein
VRYEVIGDIRPRRLNARCVAVDMCCELGSTSVLIYAPLGAMSKDVVELRIDVHWHSVNLSVQDLLRDNGASGRARSC